MRNVLAVSLVAVLAAAVLFAMPATPALAAGTPDNGYTIEAPSGVWGITQGDEMVFTVTVHRGKAFKQGVKLSFKVQQGSQGIMLAPGRSRSRQIIPIRPFT